MLSMLAATAAPAAADTEGPEIMGFGPDNVIVLIGDGMGYNHVDAASLYENGTSYSQVSVGVDPEDDSDGSTMPSPPSREGSRPFAAGDVEREPSEPNNVYEEFPVQLGMATYNVDGGYSSDDAWGDFDWVKDGATDSAAAGTALATGVHTNNGAIGLDPEGDPVRNLTERAQETDRASGVVTSVQFSHATPASFVAHNASRNNYHSIAREMLTEHEIDVVMGAGHPYFDDDGEAVEEPAFDYIDERTYESVTSGDLGFETVEEADDFADLAQAQNPPERVFGLAQAATTLQYDRSGPDRDSEGNPIDGAEPYTAPDNENVPSLSDMTAGALNVLDNASDEGMFLMVEGGAIDWAGHGNEMGRLIEEQIAFNEAVDTVVDWVEQESSWQETLVVVTADHETGYLAGPGAGDAWTPMTGESGSLPEHSWHSGDHTNSLVPLYASGPGASRIEHYSTHDDAVRGAYLEHTDVANAIFDFWGYE
ncbi:alkaline phosphatase [Spiractinospora alimapuensis]|nr:alkaline phosphatase [Spiractinospora alimapuensis]